MLGFFGPDTMTELDIINRMLMQESQAVIASLSHDEHPMIPTCQAIVENANRQIQMPGWWFNTFLEELVPEADGKIYLPDDTLKIREIPALPGYNVAQVGNVLQDLNGQELPGTLAAFRTRYLPISQIPEVAASVVAEYARYLYASDIIKDPTEANTAQTMMRRFEIMLNAENTRQARYNPLKAGRVTSKVRWIYNRNYANSILS